MCPLGCGTQAPQMPVQLVPRGLLYLLFGKPPLPKACPANLKGHSLPFCPTSTSKEFFAIAKIPILWQPAWTLETISGAESTRGQFAYSLK